MTLSDLGSVFAGDRLAVMVIVLACGIAELEIKASGIFTYGTDRGNPDFAIARATGVSAARVEKAAALDDAAAVVRHHGPALVTVRTARQEFALGPLGWSCAYSLSVTTEHARPGVLAGIRKR